jgi:hypothetical protein
MFLSYNETLKKPKVLILALDLRKHEKISLNLVNDSFKFYKN